MSDTLSAAPDAVPITAFRGVGPAMAAKLAGLGIHDARDVLFHLPFRYQDRTRLTRIGALQPGAEGVVVGKVASADVIITQKKRRSLLVRIADGTGVLPLRFFHFNQTQVRQFEPGARVQCFGELHAGMLAMVHPEYRMLGPAVTAGDGSRGGPGDGSGGATGDPADEDPRGPTGSPAGAGSDGARGDVAGDGSGGATVPPARDLLGDPAGDSAGGAFEAMADEPVGVLDDALTPFYHTTEGVQQGILRRLTEQALARLDDSSLVDWLPAGSGLDDTLPTLVEALRIVHRPPPGADVAALMAGTHPAHRRLAFEELVAHRLGLRLLRARSTRQHAPPIPPAGTIGGRLRAALGFALTGAQERVLTELAADMTTGKPMLRLVQGDVGAGKTIVAALAAADVVEAGHQVALMAPTEILAEQHLLNFVAWFEPLGIEVGWLTGKLTPARRRASLEAVRSGRARIVVGTHALFQRSVEFDDLGLAIIDEQHRFGVHQRMALRDKGAGGAGASPPSAGGESPERARRHSLPHQLIMTATPIPRTLAMTAYADLDVSLIDELPPGRQPVTTVAMDNGRRDEVIERVGVAIGEGRQVYWVCTLIEESEVLQAEAAEDTQATLDAALPDVRVGLVHGRLKPREKEAMMQSFKARDIDLLVATTVIEVGVDVPNASMMIIENAERLGLSQLHQLRGRVGRGSARSSCILLFRGPLSENARERIGIMRETTDGFLIAEKDLELRGAGEVLGTRQTGLAEFRIAELGRDDDLLEAVGTVADTLLAERPEAVRALVRRWIGDKKKDYGGV